MSRTLAADDGMTGEASRARTRTRSARRYRKAFSSAARAGSLAKFQGAVCTIHWFASLMPLQISVSAAERIKGAKKLLKLQLDVGGVPRQIVSGIAEAYEPEQLVGRTIIVIANLKPAKLMGVESHGMLLAATVDGKAVLAGFEGDVPSGTRVK